MTGYIADLLAFGGAGLSIAYAQIAAGHTNKAREALRKQIELCRPEAADPAPVEVDHGTLAPVRLRLVSPDEAREQLLTSAMQRHPAGRRSQMSPHCGEETVPPALADPLPAPGRTPKS